MYLRLLPLLILTFFSAGCGTNPVIAGATEIVTAATAASRLSTIEAGNKASNLYSSKIKPSFYNDITSPRKLTKLQQDMQDRQELMMRLQENKSLGNNAPKDPHGMERLCKSNPNNDTCKIFNMLKTKRGEKLNYKHSTHDANNKELVGKINTVISKKKLQSENKHNKYKTRSSASSNLSKKWNNLVNKVVSSEANGNIYRIVIENREDLTSLNGFLTNDKAIVTRKNGVYNVLLPDKGLENRINKLLKSRNGREIIVVAFSMKRLNKVYDIAVGMSKSGYLRNAPLIASIYSNYPKKLYIVTGKKESPKTTNVYGNLYIHEDHLSELNKYGMLNFVLHHEAMHIKDNLLGFDVLRRSTDLFNSTDNFWVQGAFVTGNDKSARRIRGDMKWAEAYFKNLVGSDMKGHSEALRELVYNKNVKPSEISEGVMGADLIREINIDMDVASRYVPSSEAFNYIQSMIHKVSFNNRYKMLIKGGDIKQSDLEDMYMTDKRYSNYKQLFADKNISDDAHHYNILGFM